MSNTNDIRPLGTEDGREAYFVQGSNASMFGYSQFLRLVVIDEFGSYEETPISKAFDPAAPTLDEAIVAHLKKNGVVAKAERELERRRKDAPPEPEPQPAPMDNATRRFFSDSEGEW